jgi:ADP-heptose:LPS heptosyltransferase
MRTLAVRQDNHGDVLLAGPALRALAAGSDRLALLCGPRGEQAARLLPGVDEIIVWEAGWIDAEPQPVRRTDVDSTIDRLTSGAFDRAVIFTSFHQSPLPTALMLRMAGIPCIGAVSVDYPGSLLDVRHLIDDDVHEVQRALSLAAAMGFELPRGDDGRLRLQSLPPASRDGCYVVLHPGCTQTARTWSVEGFTRTAGLLASRGIDVVVTGSREEAALTARVSGGMKRVHDFGGATSFAEFAALVGGAQAVVCGNTAAAHVAAAMATPVVEIFPPTVPFVRFSPWMVPYAVFGDASIACAGCRARVCPMPGHPCLREVTPERVAAAVMTFVRDAVTA